ncbi:MAG: hypothetical protein DMG10_26010 [Acidobacteria bacterium]|nr:MAG: hypothetical protein DMG10_26010 [Acidobacteriota bacterium]
MSGPPSVPRCERRPGAIGAFKVVNQNGEPFFYLGDTAWTLLKRLNREEVDEYVKNHAAKGFTGIQAYVLRGLEVKNIKPLLLAAVDEESGKDACAPSDFSKESPDAQDNWFSDLCMYVVCWTARCSAHRCSS